jgi:hypothetical protein
VKSRSSLHKEVKVCVRYQSSKHQELAAILRPNLRSHYHMWHRLFLKKTTSPVHTSQILKNSFLAVWNALIASKWIVSANCIQARVLLNLRKQTIRMVWLRIITSLNLLHKVAPLPLPTTRSKTESISLDTTVVPYLHGESLDYNSQRWVFDCLCPRINLQLIAHSIQSLL